MAHGSQGARFRRELDYEPRARFPTNSRAGEEQGGGARLGFCIGAAPAGPLAGHRCIVRARQLYVGGVQDVSARGVGWCGSYSASSPSPGIANAVTRPHRSSLIGRVNSTPFRFSSSTVASMSSHIR